MKSFILASLLVVAVSASLFGEHDAKFENFKTKFSKTYETQEEETRRFAVFRENLQSIEEHNALYEKGLVSYERAINKFSDMTKEEFNAYLGNHTMPVLKTVPYNYSGVALPESVDWRTQGQVTPVKDQGRCGASWAFSIAGSTEAAYYRKTGKLIPLTQQQIIDCSTLNNGCALGRLATTFPYVQEYGLQSESSYPYTGVVGACQYEESKVVTKIDGFVSLSMNENALQEAVATVGPVSVMIDPRLIADYSSGIFDNKYCSVFNINHSVLVVGYGSENGRNFWIVKNSWGTDWGENGYIRLLRGVNQCGLILYDYYPIIN